MSLAQIKTYLEQINSGEINSNGAKLLEHFIELEKKGKGDSLPKLHQKFQMGKATIVARLSALEDSGLLYKTGEIEKRKDTTGKPIYYSVYKHEPDPLEQEKNRYKIDDAKYQKWLNSGLKRFPHQMDDEIQTLLQNELTEELK